MLRGAALGGGLGVARDAITRQDFKKFEKGRKAMEALAPKGVDTALQSTKTAFTDRARKLVERLEKSASSTHMADHRKTRGGTRPIRVSTLLKNEKERAELPVSQEKLSSRPSTDFSMPTGSQKPAQPDFAQDQLKASQSLSNQKTKGSKLSDVVPPIQATPMPKIGTDMTIQNDPLIQYLKTAEVIEDNLEDVPKGKPEEPTTLEDSDTSAADIKENEATWRAYLKDQMDHEEGIRPKERTHPYDEGVVDRILKLK
jgi:hypothetical protein